jgi:hypothetical protein
MTKIELPPLPYGIPTYEFPDGAYSSEQMQAYATAAIEADRKRRDESLDNVPRSSRSVNQIKEALQDRSQRFTASYSEVMNLIRYYETNSRASASA